MAEVQLKRSLKETTFLNLKVRSFLSSSSTHRYSLRCGPLNLTDVEHACSGAVNSLGSERGRGSGTKNWVAGLETKATGTRRFTAIASTRTTHGGAAGMVVGLNLPHLVQKHLKRGTPTWQNAVLQKFAPFCLGGPGSWHCVVTERLRLSQTIRQVCVTWYTGSSDRQFSHNQQTTRGCPKKVWRSPQN